MRNRLAIVANIAVFTVIVFIALEMTYRVYLFGVAGLNPVKVNSFVNIFDSGLVQPADNLDVWFELKPEQSTLFRGAPFITNTHGLADDEYPYNKPPNTYRVAVIGSSWTMGAGVSLEDTFHSVLEDEFNNESNLTRYEFINFGVEHYGLGEMMGTLHHKALLYDPDMILFIMTGHTPAVRWEPHEKPFALLADESSGWTSYVALKLGGLLGINMKQSRNQEELRDTVRRGEWGLYFKQVQRAFNELAALSNSSGIPVAAAWLRLNQANTQGSTEKLGELFLQRTSELNLASAVIDLEKYLKPGEPVHKLLVNRSEKHPNSYSHKIIADQLREKIFFNGALIIPAP
jgi:hypothetical protein